MVDFLLFSSFDEFSAFIVFSEDESRLLVRSDFGLELGEFSGLDFRTDFLVTSYGLVEFLVVGEVRGSDLTSLNGGGELGRFFGILKLLDTFLLQISSTLVTAGSVCVLEKEEGETLGWISELSAVIVEAGDTPDNSELAGVTGSDFSCSVIFVPVFTVRGSSFLPLSCSVLTGSDLLGDE